ncbi:MAG TPA: S8 family serine peptidase [Pyrinomonadaceae bacterium]|nr:S8 family serine peptidase [Pyrinomonadaceae bacterium]
MSKLKVRRRMRSVRVLFAAVLVTGLALITAAGLFTPLGKAATAPVQETEGTIAIPLRFAQDATYSSWPGGQRQVWAAAGSNGHVGYTLELAEGTGGGSFTLEKVSGATGLEDFDIAFYASFNPVVSSATIATRKIGGEAGTIPDGSRFAIVTLFNGANGTFRFRAYPPSDPAAQHGGGLKPAAPPAAPGIYPNFGFEEDRVKQWAKRLASKSHVVIAVVDTGINPYHVAYRRSEYTVHPSNYIEGFPKDAPALGLSFGAADYVTARTTDDAPVWSQVAERKLYWIPGTNIIGAYSVADYAGTPPGGLPSRPIIDDDGHGTGTTSVSGGGALSTKGAPYGSNPDALLVIIEGLGDAGVKWAAEQPWIDFISGSYGDAISVPCTDSGDETVDDVADVWCGREYRYTAPFVLRDGRTALFSAGNGLSRTGVATDRYSSLRPTSGPSWVVTVGAVSARNEQDYGWHSVPADISSYGLHWPAADPFSFSGEVEFGGTSNATPVTAGVFSRVLLAARRSVGDAVEGIHITADGKSVPAYGPAGIAKGLLADGVLARTELQDAVFKTAHPEEFNTETWVYDPVVIPNTPLYYTQQGYGNANVAAALRAIEVIMGRAPMPDRSEVDAWLATVDVVRDSVYPPPTYP